MAAKQTQSTSDSNSENPSEHRPTIWIDGEVLACACPKCDAPMAIRIWLMIADCWKCGTSVELTEEQEREAQRLLDELAEVKRTGGDPAARGLPMQRPEVYRKQWGVRERW